MKLPNFDRASIQVEKISDYLLSPIHPVGRHKAVFFRQFGFAQIDPYRLAGALLSHAAENEAVEEQPSPFGRKFIVDGPLLTPDGRRPLVRTVWIIEAGDSVPRLVTAYPADPKPRSDS